MHFENCLFSFGLFVENEDVIIFTLNDLLTLINIRLPNKRANNVLRFLGSPLDFEVEIELGTHVKLWPKIDASIEFLDYHFAYHEAQTDPICIKLPFFVFDRAKKLEQFILILLFDANSRILNVNLHKIRFVFGCDLDFPLSIRKFDRIWK